jgi:hypothetical protein
MHEFLFVGLLVLALVALGLGAGYVAVRLFRR